MWEFAISNPGYTCLIILFILMALESIVSSICSTIRPQKNEKTKNCLLTKFRSHKYKKPVYEEEEHD